MRKYFLPIFAAWIALHEAGCRTGDDEKKGGDSEVSSADGMQGLTNMTAADKAAFNTNLEPLKEDKGWDSTCDGCMIFWIGKDNPNKLSNDSIYNWNSVAIKCQKKGMCKFAIENTNAWSGPRILIDLLRGPLIRWAKLKNEKKKALCLYEHAYHAGMEVCYEGPGRAILPDKLKGKISSYSMVNMSKFWARGADLKNYEIFYEDGYNLLPPFADKITEVVLLDR